jgi:aspartyl-tRNA(Asn)/glutamyl-tRNA(Gln) amidotransferase subunit A
VKAAMSRITASATELLAELNSGRLSSVELTKDCLAQIQAHDSRVQAFLNLASERALEQAAAIDRRRRTGDPLGPLAGLPIAIKDVLCTKDWATTCGSRMLEKFVPPYDSTVVEKLKKADAILIGKTNMDEFAMGGTTENSAFKKTCNPWNLSCTPGGSSGGSAASVAARMTPLAIGSDTGGSIRQPAAFCGITGLKPTYGRVSRFGLVAFASSLDQIGPMGRSAEDIAPLLQAIAGHDSRDSTSASHPVPNYSDSLRQPLESLTLGLVREHFHSGLDSEIAAAVNEAVKVFQSHGAKIKDVALPHGKYAVSTYYIIAPCEASSNLARYDGVHYGYRTEERAMLAALDEERKQAGRQTAPVSADNTESPLVRLYRQSRSEGFGTEVKRRIMLGTYALSAGYYDAYYLKALKVRRLIRRDYDEAFRDVDLIIGPTTPRPAFPIGDMADDPLKLYLEDLYTVSANLSGIAGLSMPCGMTAAGLPIGVQLQSPPFEEERLLRAAHLFQSHTDWHLRSPTLQV